MSPLFFDEPEELIGYRLDATYELTSVLGGGATAVVFSGRHLVLDRPVAVKVLHPTLAMLPEMRARFMREASAAASVDHPNLVRVSDARVSAEGVHYLVMEHLSGTDLSRWASARAPLALAQIVAIGTQVAEVLEALHRAGLVHRDLKPENIIVLEGQPAQPRVKLIDLGIVGIVGIGGIGGIGAQAGGGDPATRLTRGDVTLGTVFYMSPEQAAGATVDGRSDVYALGCVLWELAVGRPWVGEGSPSEVLARHLGALPDAPSRHRRDLPSWFDALVLRCLAKKPDQRLQSARELAAQLVEQSGASSEPGALRPSAISGPLGLAKPRTGPARWALSAVAALMCAALGFGLGRLGIVEETRAPSEARGPMGEELADLGAMPGEARGAAQPALENGVIGAGVGSEAATGLVGPVEVEPARVEAGGAGGPLAGGSGVANAAGDAGSHGAGGSSGSIGSSGSNDSGGASEPALAAAVPEPAAASAARSGRPDRSAQGRGAARSEEDRAGAPEPEKRRARLAFAVEPEGSEVRRNGVMIGRTPLSVEVDASPTTVSYEVSHPSRVTLKLVYPNEVDRVITRSLPRLEADSAVSAAPVPTRGGVERVAEPRPETPRAEEELWRPSRPGAAAP